MPRRRPPRWQGPRRLLSVLRAVRISGKTKHPEASSYRIWRMWIEWEPWLAQPCLPHRPSGRTSSRIVSHRVESCRTNCTTPWPRSGRDSAYGLRVKITGQIYSERCMFGCFSGSPLHFLRWRGGGVHRLLSTQYSIDGLKCGHRPNWPWGKCGTQRSLRVLLAQKFLQRGFVFLGFLLAIGNYS